MTNQGIDLTDIPEVTDEQMARTRLRGGGKPASRGKVRGNTLDADIVEYFKFKAGSQGYQTLVKYLIEKEDML